jgi:hypothetical protein
VDKKPLILATARLVLGGNGSLKGTLFLRTIKSHCFLHYPGYGKARRQMIGSAMSGNLFINARFRKYYFLYNNTYVYSVNLKLFLAVGLIVA